MVCAGLDPCGGFVSKPSPKTFRCHVSRFRSVRNGACDVCIRLGAGRPLLFFPFTRDVRSADMYTAASVEAYILCMDDNHIYPEVGF